MLNKNFFFCFSITGLDRPLGLQEVEAHRTFKHSAHEGGKVASPTHRPPLTSGDTLDTHFCYRMSRTDGLSEKGRIIPNDHFGNRARDLPACSTASQPTAPPHMIAAPSQRTQEPILLLPLNTSGCSPRGTAFEA